MLTRKRLGEYLDIELPAEELLFHVAMVLSMAECLLMMLFSLLARMNTRIPIMLFTGMLLTTAAMYAQMKGGQIKWISVVYLILMHMILLPLASFYTPGAIYDFPVYFLTGIAFTAILLRKKWALVFITADMAVDLACIYYMLEDSAVTEMKAAGHVLDDMLLFLRIVLALSITGTVCGILIYYRNRVLRREIEKSSVMEQQAGQLSYAKNMFLVNVSHEIRTPLNAILGITELLADLDVDDRMKENAFHISNSSKALLSITNELMDFSRLDDSELIIADKPYYIGDICNELVNVVSVRFADYRVEMYVDIEPDIPAQLYGDETMVRQMMLHVLTGVIKSMESGEMYLSVCREEIGEESIRLCVEARAEGTFRHSYRNLLNYEGRMREDEETVTPLPYRLVRLMGGELYMEEELNRRKYHFDIPQKYVPGAMLVSGEYAADVRVLFYENSTAQGSVFANALRKMGIGFCQASTNELFFAECVKKEYSHIMIAAERYEGMRDRLEQILSPQTIVLIGTDMLTYEDTLVRTTFSRPVNCLNLDALLSNKQNSTIRHVGYRGGFICPDARIMVVDDNMVNLEVATSLLNRYKAQVLVAASGKECIRLLAKEKVDFIFLDYMMPEMDGIDTLKNIRALNMSWLDNVWVVALTANAVSGAREMFLEAGFDEYISKPIERDKFEKILRTGLPEDKIIYTTDRQGKAGQSV